MAVLRLLPDGTFEDRPVRLQTGSVVPDFRATKHDGKYWRLTDNRGRIVVLFFHAGINRGINANVATSLCDAVESLKAGEVAVYAISNDRPEVLREAFGEGKYPSLLSDADGAIGTMYGFPAGAVPVGRPFSEICGHTFVVGGDGVLISSLRVDDAATHTAEVLGVLTGGHDDKT
jgi:peroxiredoxin